MCLTIQYFMYCLEKNITEFMKYEDETFASVFKSNSFASYVNMINFGIILFITATLSFKLCLSTCARAEYDINGECCPMCAPGNHVHWHCTVDTSTTCVPCSASTYIDEPNGLDKCFPCSVCDREQGLGIKRSCTRSADTVCEPLEGFYCGEQNKGGCRFAVKHSECHPGQYIRQAGTAFTDTVCINCTEGTFSNGSFTTCQPHSICETEGQKVVKAGTMSSNVECEKSVPVSIIVGVIVVIIGVLGTAVGIKMYPKFKQRRQSLDRDINYHSIPIQESNSAVPEERPTPEGACEPAIKNEPASLQPEIVEYRQKSTLSLTSQRNLESEAKSDHDKEKYSAIRDGN